MDSRKMKKEHKLNKFNQPIVTRVKFETPSTQIHDSLLFVLGTGTSIKKVAGLN